MIHVFFVPGMFGSTIEYIIRAYSQEFDQLRSEIEPNGAMHSFNKLHHWLSLEEICDSYKNKIEFKGISTPTYPYEDHHLPEILETVLPLFDPTDKKIIIYASNVKAAEINMLFRYHKISVGLNTGLSVFFGKVDPLWIRWNPEYTRWQDMKHWELREWLSVFYPAWVQEWIDSENQVDDEFLKISNVDIIEHTEGKFLEIFNHCNLTQQPGLSDFAKKWQNAQQYILDEYSTILKIVESTVSRESYSWQPLNIVAEAIIQQHLRSNGYEIRCDGLNTFPTDSETLYNLLEKI